MGSCWKKAQKLIVGRGRLFGTQEYDVFGRFKIDTIWQPRLEVLHLCMNYSIRHVSLFLSQKDATRKGGITLANIINIDLYWLIFIMNYLFL